MSTLFKRRVQVVVDSLLVEDLRVTFRVKKTSKPEPNTCELKIFNLAEKTRAQMKNKGSKVVLQAGYDQVLGTCFSGDARTIDHAREGATWVTKVECGDGEQAYGFSRMSESFAPGTSMVDVAKKCALAMKVNLGNALEQLKTGNIDAAIQQFTHGYVAHGKASAELDKLLSSAGLEWSIQDGALQLVKVGQLLPGEAVLLNASTGLLDSPEHGTPAKPGKPNFLKLKSLLQATIKPETPLQVDSLFTKGLYKAVTVEHEGDTAGGLWETRVEALPA